MVVDKVNTQVLVFDPNGTCEELHRPSWALHLATIQPPALVNANYRLSCRTNAPLRPLCCFTGRDLHGIEILWIDNATAHSLLGVVKGTQRE